MVPGLLLLAFDSGSDTFQGFQWLQPSMLTPLGSLRQVTQPLLSLGVLGFPSRNLLGFGVILGPDSFEFVQMVGTKDRPIPCQVVKVVHDNCYKEVDDLQGTVGTLRGFAKTLTHLLPKPTSPASAQAGQKPTFLSINNMLAFRMPTARIWVSWT